MFNTFWLNFGFAEDGSIAYVPMAYTGKGFKKREDAILSLAEYLKKRFIGDPKTLNKCCECFKKQNKKFCADCGTSLIDEDFDIEAFKDYLKEFPALTCDTFGYSWEENQEGEYWTPEVDMSELLKAKNVLVLISAEKILETALISYEGLCDLLKNENQEDPNVILGE